MTKKNCEKEAEIATINTKQKNIEKVLFGNGVEGVLKQLKDIGEAILLIKSQYNIRSWVMRGAIVVLLGISAFLASYVWYIKFGGI